MSEQVPRRPVPHHRRHAHLTDPPFIRLLAQLMPEAEAKAAKPPFAERLSEWLHWTDAGDLAAILEASAVPAPAAGPAGPAPDVQALRQVLQVRQAMLAAIAKDCDVATQGWDDLAEVRRRYAARQQAMQASVAGWRARLRAALAGCGAEWARLAALDALMERSLAARERALLGGVPAWLEAGWQGQVSAEMPTQVLAQMSAQMQDLLLAEWDLRWQPVEALHAALQDTTFHASRTDCLC